MVSEGITLEILGMFGTSEAGEGGQEGGIGREEASGPGLEAWADGGRPPVWPVMGWWADGKEEIVFVEILRVGGDVLFGDGEGLVATGKNLHQRRS